MEHDDVSNLARLRMVRDQLAKQGIYDRRVLDIMSRVPRERFVHVPNADEAYADRAMPIACHQTISQPIIVALMTEALRLTGKETVLEIGTGSGYQTAILAELAERVISIERFADLSASARRVLEDLGYRNIKLIVGDGTRGWIEEAPYSRILVTAAAAECPQALLDQLADGGILVIPLGDSTAQMLQTIERRGERLVITDITPCRFVPLVGAGQADAAEDIGDNQSS